MKESLYGDSLKGSSAEEDYRKQLIGMIELCWMDLQQAVWQRNGSLRSLGALRVSPDEVGNAEPTNIYVTYWKESHGLPATPASGTNATTREISSGASNVQPSTKKLPAQPEVPGGSSSKGSSSKRSREQSRQPARNDHNVYVGTDSDKKIKNALREDVPSSGSLNPSTPGKGQRHLDTGFRHANGSPAHKSDLPATPSTASSTAAGSHSPPAPVEPA
ncbi:hypothetical protein H0H93_009240, partial [Arthromyces matolae]